MNKECYDFKNMSFLIYKIVNERYVDFFIHIKSYVKNSYYIYQH